MMGRTESCRLRVDGPGDGGLEYAGRMQYEITVEPRYLMAKMSDRETGEETREFLRAVILEYVKFQHSSIIIDLSSSRPIFDVKSHGFLEFFRMLADDPSCRIALLGDAKDLNVSHEYIALLARQQGMNVQDFADETAAVLWLSERRQLQERRQLHERRQRHPQRHHREQRYSAESRRQRERRNASLSQLSAA